LNSRPGGGPDGKMIPFGDKANVLGTRWMSLQATSTTNAVHGYGLHGTWEPERLAFKPAPDAFAC